MRFRFLTGLEHLLLEGEPDLLGGGGAPPVEPPAGEEPPAELPEGREWLKGVDMDFINDPSMASINDINSLAKSYINAQKMVGKDKIVVPDEHASDEDWGNIFKKLGHPDRDNFKVDFGESKYDDTFKNAFLDAAHQNNIMPRQAKAMFDFWDSQISEATNADNTERTAAMQAKMEGLKKDWGEGFQAEMATAQQAVKQFASEEDMKFLQESGMATNPDMIRLFNKIGKSLNEDTFNRDQVKHLGMTKDEAQEKLNSILMNPDHPYWNAAHPSHKAAVSDATKYQGIIHN